MLPRISASGLPQLIFFFPTLLVLLAYAAVPVIAQTVTVQGFISDGSSGQSLTGANVILQGINDDSFQGSSTDGNGYYNISGIQPGEYALTVTYLGYTSHQDTLSLENESNVTINLTLQPSDEMLDDLIISLSGGSTRQSVGRQRVAAVDLDRVVTPAGSGDLVSYLQTQPGVVSAGDRGGQLFIRGGTPSQNMVLIDGAMIYQPFHIVGFFSAFPEDLVAGADFYAGGYGAKYSGRVSSVIDVQMRDGNMYEHQGSASISPFLGEIMAEGPIKEGESSWIASTRHSLIEHSSPAFLPERQPLKFESQFLKVSHRDEDLRCSAMAMRTYDRGRLDYELDDAIRWSNFVMGGRCLSLPSGQADLMEMKMNLSQMSNSMTAGESELFSKTTRFTIDVNMTRRIGNIGLQYGGFINIKFLNYNMAELFHAEQSDDPFILGSGVYAETDFSLGERVNVRPGAVFTIYPGQYNPSFEPRLQAAWQPFGRDEEELSMAAGIYRQPLVGVNDMRDVSSVFTGWMPAPQGGSQKQAIHALLGWGQKLGGGFQWSLEGFYKRISHQPITVWNTDAQFNTNLALANGNIYGSDLRLEYNHGPVFWFGGYGYTWTEYISSQEHFTSWFGDPVQRFHPPHDRRHQVNTQLSVNVGKYQTNLGWQFGTGLPYTRPLGFDERLNFNDGLPTVGGEYGTPRMITEKPYQGRLPRYHRLDVSVRRSFTFPSAKLDLQVGAINLYDQANMYFYDVYTHRRVDQLPIAPYVSIQLKTR